MNKRLTLPAHCLLSAILCCTSVMAVAQPSEAQQSDPSLITKPVTKTTSIKKDLTEITVTAELLQNSVLQLPNSVSVIDDQQIEQRSAQHLEDLLNLAPNVNFASGASRGRFIQIRGIGERSEFQDPINNSVGLIVDGIDLTGIATAATALDIKQVEVFRGPQGTLFGANALAGLINMVSNKPTDDFYAKLTTDVQDYGGLQYSAVVSGPTSQESGYRLAVKHYESDGYIDNIFLQREDTNNINEDTARATYHWQAKQNLSFDFTLFLADIDNGFDAFSLDNTRQTYSDQPGYDRQETVSGAIKTDWAINQNLSFISVISTASSDLEYAYDEDWAHPNICVGTACDKNILGYDLSYSSFDSYLRDNKNTSIDLRLVSKSDDAMSWVLGLYHRDQRIDLLRQYTYLSKDFRSRLDSTNSAIYGQVDMPLTQRWSLTSGLRYEMRDVDYQDNNAASANPDENLWGGRIALQYHANENSFYYALISRGYKAGGFNLDGNIAAQNREFDTETMVNYELGLKQNLFDGDMQLQAALFYQDRDDIQSKQSNVRSIATGQVGDPCPCTFNDFIDNAAGGDNYGLELTLDWQVNEKLSVFTNAGLLKTGFDTLLTFDHVQASRDKGIAFDLKGREQAHAPSYQIALGGRFAITPQWQLSGSVEAKDAFYFSDRHSEKSDAYVLLNLELAYQKDNWRVALYGKNLTDELIETRGFGSFGNDPRKFYSVEPYNQYAAPRLVGIKASMEFK